MDILLFFIGTFLIIYLFYFIFVIHKANALKKMQKSKEVKLLCQLGKIDQNKVEFKRLATILSLANSFIIALMGSLVMLLNKFITNFYVWLIVSALIALVLLVPLIIGTYKIAGKLIKKERK